VKRALLLAAVVVLALAAVAAGRAARLGGRTAPPSAPDPLQLDSAGAIGRFAAAIRIPTVSEEDSARRDPRQFAALHQLFDSGFPALRTRLTREAVNQYSLLYRWPGADSGAAAVLLAAHQDVVPADPARWSHAPFSGAIAGGFVWGRGTLDDKIAVLGVLEAVNALAAEGFRPRRTLYLAFGHDEELGGDAGAAAIAALLRTRHVALETVLDEGGAILQGVVPGVAVPVATVGVAEKGSVTLALTAHGAGGHSSMPPRRTAIGALSQAIDRLERDQFPARLDGASLGLFDAVGPEMAWPYRVLFANLWLFRPAVLRALTSAPSTAAAVRTTIAPTTLQAGIKENVLAPTARALVNLRILPGETVASVAERVRRVVDDSTVTVSIVGRGDEPSPVSPVDTAPYRALATAIRQVYPTAIAAPFLVVGATDARHYSSLTRNVYRFAPLPLTNADLDRLHGVDERIAIADYLRAVRWYAQVIRNLVR